MVWCILNVCESMVEIGTEPDPKSKIWRLTGFGVFRAGAGFGVNFSDSAHLW